MELLHCFEKTLQVPYTTCFDQINIFLRKKFIDQQILRVTISSFDTKYFNAHVLLTNQKLNKENIFNFNKRSYQDENKFNVCFLIPTGIGCEIGGHAGDGTPSLKLIASACDQVVTHPNVVNASDINEMPENAFYVEGHHVTDLLMGNIGLSKARSNRILVLIDGSEKRKRFRDLAINSVNAARVTLGIDAEIEIIDPLFQMEAFIKDNKAIGKIEHLEKIINLVSDKIENFDAIAIASPILVDEGIHESYSKSHGEMVNPWGGVESMLTHAISSTFNKPSAHAPMIEDEKTFFLELGIVDSRISPEIVSSTFLHCVLKGLHRAPKITKANEGLLAAKNISALVIPDGILGLPVLAALHQGIKVIAVKNKNTMKNDLSKLPWKAGQFFKADGFLEACGILKCLKEGISVESVKRPLRDLSMEIELADNKDLSFVENTSIY